uniref:Uncharacterized protein n=1 Tax=Kalanchoe fedtschenkoi TaxID=63787 RepID=A0A7N0UAB9_KALFE
MLPPPEAADDRGCHVEERACYFLRNRINQLSENQVLDPTIGDKNCAHFWRRGAAATYPYQ